MFQLLLDYRKFTVSQWTFIISFCGMRQVYNQQELATNNMLNTNSYTHTVAHYVSMKYK